MQKKKLKIGITERGDGGLDQSWRLDLQRGFVDGVVVVTKAPHLINDLPEHTVLHCTITGLGGTIIEPYVAPSEITVIAYKKLVRKYGQRRIVLRVDPILPWGSYLEKAREIVKIKEGRIRISFIDMYPHVVERFKKAGININDTVVKNCFHVPLAYRKELLMSLGRPEVCGEPGIECTGCVSQLDIEAMRLDTSCCSISPCGQRAACACLAEKVELFNRRGQCSHGCLYCYWK